MFAVLETATIPSRRIWTGGSHRITLQDKPQYVRIKLDVPLRAREGRLRKQAKRALRAASKRGSAGIVLPTDFPFPDLAGECGLVVSTPVPLLRRLAAPLCRVAVEDAGFSWDKVKLTLIGSRSSPEMLSSAQALASSVRTLYLDAGEDTAAACYLLRSRCGVAIVGRSTAAKAANPGGFPRGGGDTVKGSDDQNVVIIFDRTDQPFCISDKALVLNLTGGVPNMSGGRIIDGAVLEPPRSMWKGWPAGCDAGALLAALLATEQVSLGEIAIRGLRYV